MHNNRTLFHDNFSLFCLILSMSEDEQVNMWKYELQYIQHGRLPRLLQVYCRTTRLPAEVHVVYVIARVRSCEERAKFPNFRV